MCDTVVVVREGRVLFAKNSDRDPNEAQVLDWQPARVHPPGATLSCTWIRVPQVRRTHAVLLGRPFWMWGAEMGANEHGVVVGNEAVFTNQPYARAGLTGMDLVRLALERAETAAEAVDVIGALLQAHGQGGGCGHEDRAFTYHNSFLVADARGAYVVETAGRHFAVEPVRGVRAISNALSIPTFAEEFGDALRTAVARGRVRRARVECLAADATGAGDLMRALRDHGPGRFAPRWSGINGGMDAPCMHAGGLVANSQTTGSWVAELTPEGARHWVTGTAAPCVSLFKPARVDQPLDTGPTPGDRADPYSLWWRHERLHRRAVRDLPRLGALFLPARDAVEAAWLAAPPSPAAAFAEADRLLKKWTAAVEAVAAGDRRPWWARRYWRVRERRAGRQG